MGRERQGAIERVSRGATAGALMDGDGSGGKKGREGKKEELHRRLSLERASASEWATVGFVSLREERGAISSL